MADSCWRCSHERRYVKKELNKWHKNAVLLVGMERVAQELMGGRKWRKLMTPYNSLEQREPQDWSPNETCCLCNTKTQSSYNSTEIVPPSDDLLDENTSNNNLGDKCSLCAGLSQPNSDCLLCSCKSSQSHSPLSNDQPLDLSTHSRHKGSANSDKDEVEDLGDIENSLIKVPQPKTKATKRSRLPTTTTWKRTYTEEELQAALRDIQSGKLGTRRAAVIYGIPRSTLRNKVYKLALDRTNGKRKPSVGQSSTSTNTSANNTTANSGKKSSKTTVAMKNNCRENMSEDSNINQLLDSAENSSTTSASESLKQLLKNAIIQRANISTGNVSTGKAKSAQSITESNVGSMLSLPAFSNFTDLYNTEALATIQMLSTLECGQALAPLFTQFLLNIHQLALAKHNSDDNYNLDDLTNLRSASNSSNIPILPDLIRKLAEDQIVETTARSNSNQLLNSDKNEPQLDVSGNNNVILKVPSYKPKTISAVNQSELKHHPEEQQQNVNTSDNNEPVNKCSTSSSHESDERINEFESKSFSLKEIIAKSISQRLYTTSAKYSANVANSEDSSSDALVSDDKYSAGPDVKNSGNVSDHSNPSTPEKRNRPKRGRYRNYNRDDLAKAVKAVQRGEMSVHRAGTLFGVPHSTLEYKVKERHLLRPKKRHHDSSLGTKKESAVKSNGNTTNVVVNGSPNNSSNNSAIANTDNSVNLPFWQSGFPFFPVDINNTTNSANFFASNMMRKLQENARMNEEVVKSQSDSNNEYGGLLLESLIKSSLVNNSINTKIKAEVEDDNNNSEQVVNTSLELLKEVSALGKKE